MHKCALQNLALLSRLVGRQTVAASFVLHPDPHSRTARTAFAAQKMINMESVATERSQVPSTQIAFLFVWRASQTLFYQSIFPFVSAFLVHLEIADVENVGHFSGALEAVAALTCVLSLPFWVEIGECYGRKPTILIGVALASVAASLFGFGQTYGQLLVCRAITGFMNGAMAALAKTMAIEMSGSHDVARTLSWCSAGFQTGLVAGPAIGAALSQPAETWPALFRGSIFDDKFPFALGPLVVAAIPFTFVLFGIFQVEETLPAQDRSKAAFNPLRPYLALFTAQNENKETLWSQPILFIMGLICCLEILIVSVLQLEVLLFFEPQNLGGLGLSPQQMSIYMISRPIMMAVYEVNIFPRLHRQFGVAKIFHTFTWGFVVLYFLFWTTSKAASDGTGLATIVPLLFSMLLATTYSCTVFIGKDVAAADRAPTKGHVAAINAFSETSSQIGVAIGTIFSSNLYAFVLQRDPANGGRSAYILMALLSVLTSLYAMRYTDQESWRHREISLQEETQLLETPTDVYSAVKTFSSSG